MSSIFGVDQQVANRCGCAAGNCWKNAEKSFRMIHSPEKFCGSYTTSKACSDPHGECCRNRATNASKLCNCSKLSTTCKCSPALIASQYAGCAYSCSNERQRKWMNFLWKMESRTNQRKNTCMHTHSKPKTFRPWSPIDGSSKLSCNNKCACCDISRKFTYWSPNVGTLECLSTNKCTCCRKFCPWSLDVGPSSGKCQCTDAGHDTHFFCNATDQNNLLARVAAIRYKIRRTFKWLAINMVILIIAYLDDDFPTLVHVTFVTIAFLNICYYIQNLINLSAALIRIKLERSAYWTKNCLWEKNLPQNLTRYFEIRNEEFFYRYWRHFSNLIPVMRTVRSSPVGRAETKMGIEEDLRMLGDTVLRTHQEELKARSKFEEARRRLPLMKHIEHPVCSSKQLKTYWKNYDQACEDELVRLSADQLLLRPQLPGKQNAYLQCNEGKIYHEVVIPSVLRRSQYQESCGDAHPNPTITSTGSFYDFMKIHHEKDYCSSLHWVANLKFWLSTKMKEIVEQFDMANCLLVRNGASNARIGTSSIADLYTSFRQNEELATFIPLLEFLSLTHNQVFLVRRYRLLASQPCLTLYCWKSGGDQERGLEAGPSDSEIVLHFFCSYMDMKLPGLPFHPAEKRPFSDRYLIRPEKLQQTFVDIALVQQFINPPHFNVVVKGRVYEIQGGSNNLFLALSYLIYCIKIYQQGKIGRVSLDRPGLDILWIVGDTKKL